MANKYRLLDQDEFTRKGDEGWNAELVDWKAIPEDQLNKTAGMYYAPVRRLVGDGTRMAVATMLAAGSLEVTGDKVMLSAAKVIVDMIVNLAPAEFADAMSDAVEKILKGEYPARDVLLDKAPELQKSRILQINL